MCSLEDAVQEARLASLLALRRGEDPRKAGKKAFLGFVVREAARPEIPVGLFPRGGRVA